MHIPVLVAEVLKVLHPRPGQILVDATVGAGGHAEALLKGLGPKGRLIGIDKDAQALESAARNLRAYERCLTFVQTDFRHLNQTLETIHVETIHGILFDLGVSSLQLDSPDRGFSFQHDAPLDMRMDHRQATSAAELVSRLSEWELSDLLHRYGEERFARRIARRIVEARRQSPIRTTARLAQVVTEATPRSPKGSRLHPATRTFQALRIAVNDELGALQDGLDQAIERLAPKGRIAVISFHSLEDRIVKQTFRRWSNEERAEILTRKPIESSDAEAVVNPRSRSAKLRAAEKIK